MAAQTQEPDWIAMILALMVVGAIMFITLYDPLKMAANG